MTKTTEQIIAELLVEAERLIQETMAIVEVAEILSGHYPKAPKPLKKP